MNNIMYKFLSCLTGALVVFGLSGNAAAEGCESYYATFTGSIGSQTSCADHYMSGCVVGSGGTTCTYTGSTCDFQMDVALGVGQSPDNSTTFVVTNPDNGKPTCQVKMAFTQGNQGANYCQNIYPSGVAGDTLTTLGSKDTAVSHKQLEVCTDEIVVFAPKPNISIESTVVRVDYVDSSPVYDCADGVDILEIIAPTEVAYCHTISNSGGGTIEDLTLSVDGGDPEDLGSLSGGSEISLDSGPVPFTIAGEFVTTATASGLFQGVLCDTCSDSDTVTVNVAVACDESTQIIADATGTVVESNSVDGSTRCSPAKVDDVSVTRSVGLLCDGSCEVKEDCKGSPISCLQPCKPSHNWTYQVGTSDVCKFAEPKPGKLPLCQEVLGNPNNSFSGVPEDPESTVLCSETIHNPSTVQSNSHRTTYSSNPTLYYFPSSGGGDSTGTIYCFLAPYENASDCPSGSFVY